MLVSVSQVYTVYIIYKCVYICIYNICLCIYNIHICYIYIGGTVEKRDGVEGGCSLSLSSPFHHRSLSCDKMRTELDDCVNELITRVYACRFYALCSQSECKPDDVAYRTTHALCMHPYTCLRHKSWTTLLPPPPPSIKI